MRSTAPSGPSTRSPPEGHRSLAALHQTALRDLDRHYDPFDLTLATVPRAEAGTAAGILSTAQRVGTAAGIAVIGTVLFGGLKSGPGPHAAASAFTHSAQLALLVNLVFMAVALILVIALPRRIPA